MKAITCALLALLGATSAQASSVSCQATPSASAAAQFGPNNAQSQDLLSCNGLLTSTASSSGSGTQGDSAEADASANASFLYVPSATGFVLTTSFRGTAHSQVVQGGAGSAPTANAQGSILANVFFTLDSLSQVTLVGNLGANSFVDAWGNGAGGPGRLSLDAVLNPGTYRVFSTNGASAPFNGTAADMLEYSLVVTTVPVPAGLWLFISGVGCLATLARRTRIA